MALDRYQSDNFVKGGKLLATNTSIIRIRNAARNGGISVSYRVLRSGERLDTIAGEVYGDGRLWWIIAASSNIGWWLQVPPGTRLSIPNDLSQIDSLI